MAKRLDKALQFALLNDPLAFTELGMGVLEPGVFQLNWHLETIAHKLDRFVRGEIKRLIICAPPRSLKSIMSTVVLPTWIHARDPRSRIITVSYDKALAAKHCFDSRQIMESSLYQRLCGTRLTKSTESYYQTNKGGFRRATSVEGGITGHGAHHIIVDDPTTPALVQSEVERKKVNQFFGGSLFTRLDNPKRGGVALVTQRLHEDDLVGHLLGLGDWELVSIPMVAEEDSVYELLGGESYHRKAGEYLWEDRFGPEEAEERRRFMGPRAYSAQYQQRPLPMEGVHVQLKWFPRYEQPLPRYPLILQSWDAASTLHENSDFSCCVTFGILPDAIHLLDVFRFKLEFPDLRRQAYRLYRKWGAHSVLIECSDAGRALAQQLSDEGELTVEVVQPLTSKRTRLLNVIHLLEEGLVHLPRKAPWLDTFLSELLGFPGGAHDDQVDAFTQLLQYHKEMAMRAKAKNPLLNGSASTSAGHSMERRRLRYDDAGFDAIIRRDFSRFFRD